MAALRAPPANRRGGGGSRRTGGRASEPVDAWALPVAAIEMPTRVGSLTYRNPVCLASGLVDETGGSIARAAMEGAGAVVTKSVGERPERGHPAPNLVEVVEGGALNAMGLPNPGIEAYGAEMATALEGARPLGCPVIGSVYAGSAGAFAKLAARMEEYGAAAIELNLSCPHAKGMGSDIGERPELVKDVVGRVVDAVTVPVHAKLTPNVADPVPPALAAVDAGAQALVAINTVRAMAIDVRLARPILGHGTGGLSGPAVKPVGIRVTWDVHAALRERGHEDVPLVGVGGIETSDDALEYVLAGASAVQVGTAIMSKGYAVFTQVAAGMQAWLKEEGHGSLAEVVGLAHPRSSL